MRDFSWPWTGRSSGGGGEASSGSSLHSEHSPLSPSSHAPSCTNFASARERSSLSLGSLFSRLSLQRRGLAPHPQLGTRGAAKKATAAKCDDSSGPPPSPAAQSGFWSRFLGGWKEGTKPVDAIAVPELRTPNVPSSLQATGGPPSAPEKTDSSAPLVGEDVAALDSLAATAPVTTPVFYDQFNREFANTSQIDVFDGFRLEASKRVAPGLLASHSLILGTSSSPDGAAYQFGPVYTSPDSKTTLMARCGLDGMVTCRWFQKFSELVSFKMSAQSAVGKEPLLVSEFSLEFHDAQSYASALRMSWQQRCWIFEGNYSKVLSPNLQAGFSLLAIPMNLVSILSGGFRYAAGRNVVSGTLTRQPDFDRKSVVDQSLHTAKVNYTRRLSDRLSFVTELEASDSLDSNLQVGYDYSFRQSRIQGMVDTKGQLSLLLQDASGRSVG
eukprot:GHVU01202029.1.p1 GENE.GHVU01202029.1~~GHVU01202029.1.p1  ORF type:complete len:441 (+),score=48.06 GHVU01202029.1:1122-2444(+)